MSSTVIGQCGITLYDISTQITENSIRRLVKSYVPNAYFNIFPGDICYKMGKEIYTRIYIILDKVDNVDILMKQRSNLRLNGEPLKIIRTLPKSCPLYYQSVTGLKIKIYQSMDEKVNESDLRRRFKRFGTIRYCQWTNKDQTEALFAFVDFDAVDQIIFHNPSLEIKGIKIDLEKTWTNEDYEKYACSYVIHVTNLPVRVTSEEISNLFKVPIAVILLYPCFRLEQSYLVDGRSSSEAWIKNFTDEKTARVLAQQKTGTFLRTNKIQCEAMVESINEDELCRQFEKGQCQFTMETCHYKHFSCSEPDICDDENCWYGHSQQRITKSINRPQYRSDGVMYRVRISNLPSNVTEEDLMKRLKIDSHNLKLQPIEKGSNSSRMAYLTRQPSENKLRKLIDKWHNSPFSPIITEKIQCQLEINQEPFEWDDLTDITRSSVSSTRSSRSSSTNSNPWVPSATSTNNGRLHQTRESHTVVQSHPPIIPKNKPTSTTLKSKSVPGIQQSPSDFVDLSSSSWLWTNQMILNDQFDRDQLYWIEDKSNKENNVVTKIYSTKTDRTALVRAQRERVALEHLTKFACAPKLLKSNIDVSNNNSSTKDFWIIMKLIDGERLSDYIKGKKIDVREGLRITRRLLKIIKEIHARNVIHRDIQPKNILIGQQSDIMLINFSSAWINNHQQTQSFENIDDQLGNNFYRMQQFEIREDNVQLKQFQHSPTIDTTGICAILFWLITGREPKESQDLEENPPHRLRDNSKIIDKKINEVTGFRIEMKIHEHLHRHLMLIFDRSFGNPQQQWSVVELDYQLQLIVALIDGEREGIMNYFPSPPSNLNNNLSSSIIPYDDPFVYVVSLIYHLKKQFSIRYLNCIRWSCNEKNHWRSQDEKIECNDLLIFSYQTKNLSINIQWNILLLKEQHFSITIKAKLNDKIHIELPLGIWKITHEQINDFHHYLNNFEIEMKILINVLCQSITS